MNPFPIANLLTAFPDGLTWNQAEVGDSWLVVSPELLPAIATFLKSDADCLMDMLSSISGVDYGEAAGKMEVVYHFYSVLKDHSLILKVSLDRNKAGEPLPSLHSISSIYKTANWHEREVYDLFGIHFENHLDLRRILLPADWEGFPMRKDYVEQETYHEIKVKS